MSLVEMKKKEKKERKKRENWYGVDIVSFGFGYVGWAVFLFLFPSYNTHPISLYRMHACMHAYIDTDIAAPMYTQRTGNASSRNGEKKKPRKKNER